MLSIEGPSKNGMMRPMSRLRYWHPVLTANELPRDRPVGVQVAGRNIVLFRTSGGAPGALEDKCVHRRLKLSVGTVEKNRLRCAYHGWSYTTDGEAESPGTPTLRACARSYARRGARGRAHHGRPPAVRHRHRPRAARRHGTRDHRGDVHRAQRGAVEDAPAGHATAGLDLGRRRLPLRLHVPL